MIPSHQLAQADADPVQAVGMSMVYFQKLGLPESIQRRWRLTDLNLREVARQLQYRSLALQLASQEMINVPLDEAAAHWSFAKLRKLTSHDGSEADPYLFSEAQGQTGEHPGGAAHASLQGNLCRWAASIVVCCMAYSAYCNAYLLQDSIEPSMTATSNLYGSVWSSCRDVLTEAFQSPCAQAYHQFTAASSDPPVLSTCSSAQSMS